LDDDDANRAVRVRIETVERGLSASRRCDQDHQQRRQGEKLPNLSHGKKWGVRMIHSFAVNPAGKP
jgi:hypothetical protein